MPSVSIFIHCLVFCALCYTDPFFHVCFTLVKYVDFKMGDESGYIRFEEAEAAQKARAAAVLAKEEGLVVKNFIATLEPVTGEHQN